MNATPFSKIPATYQELCLRTEAPQTPEKWLAMLGDYRMLHGLCGLASELGELGAAAFHPTNGHHDWVNIQEEVGDCMWYIHLICDARGWDLATLFAQYDVPRLDATKYLSLSMYGLFEESALMFDRSKRRWAYGMLEDYDPVPLLKIIRYLEHIVAKSGASLETCQEMMLMKLQKRYPDRFTIGQAAARNLPAERSVMEPILAQDID